MPRTRRPRKREMVTFRVERNLKQKLAQIAQRDDTSLAGLMRELAEKCVEQEERREFQAEARRQSLEIAELARTSGTDEHAVMRELEGHMQWFLDEWK